MDAVSFGDLVIILFIVCGVNKNNPFNLKDITSVYFVGFNSNDF